jgi:hypothetical protein
VQVAIQVEQVAGVVLKAEDWLHVDFLVVVVGLL